MEGTWQSIIPDTVIAYTAGLLDGEGSVYIIGYKNRSGSPLFTLRTYICNTHEGVIEFVASWFGGHISEHRTSTGKTLYRVNWCSVNAQNVLRTLLPYLIIKKELARLAIDFQEQINLRGKTTRPLTTDEVTVRQSYAELVALNQTRGKYG